MVGEQGLVSTYSQKYPHTNGTHPVGDEFTKDTLVETFKRGKWYYQWERNMDHLDICLSPELWQVERQKEFYARLFDRLAQL